MFRGGNESRKGRMQDRERHLLCHGSALNDNTGLKFALAHGTGHVLYESGDTLCLQISITLSHKKKVKIVLVVLLYSMYLAKCLQITHTDITVIF
jgi:hypothetical protein